MTPDDVSNHLDDPKFQSILVDCYRAMENGTAIAWDELQVENPQFAAALQALKGDAEFLGTLARSRGSKYESDESKLTLDSNATSHEFNLGDHVKYIGEYEILDEIARGGMGIVFKARQQKLDRIVALKMILSGQLADEADVERFHREAQAAGRLRHPGIVAVHEIGQHEGHHYFTMDYIQGHSLADEIRDETLSPARAANLVQEISGAVHFAHQQGTTHRDLKPANILIDEQERPHVTDFGLAKVIRDDNTRAHLTATGQILGTPSYMSPEQASGNVELTGPWSDIYSLGAILYACLTGRAPFVAQSPVDTLLQVAKRDPVSPRQLNPSVPKDLETVCLKCLDKKPSRRYTTAQALAEDLARFSRGEPVLARPITKAEKLFRLAKRNPVVTALMATTLTLLLVAVAIFIHGYRQTSRALEIAAGEIYGNQIALAARDLEGQQRNQAVWTLKNTQSERRGWEWHHLMNRCYPNQFIFKEVDRKTQICLTERPYRVIGGRTVVVDEERHDKLGVIFDVESGKEIKQLKDFELVPLNSPQRYALGFDPKARRLLKIVDIVLGEVRSTITLPPELEPHQRINYTSPDHFTKVAISRDGSQVIIVQQQDGPLHWGVWSLETGKPIALHVKPWARFADLSEGGERIAFRHPDDLQEVYTIADVGTGKEIFRTLDFVRHVTNDTAVYHSGEGIGIVSDEQKRVLYEDLNLSKDRPMKLVNVTTGPDNKYLAFQFFADSSNRHVFPKSVVDIWRCSDWHRQSRIEVDAGIRSVTFSPDNELVATPIHELLGGASFAYWNVSDGSFRHSWRPRATDLGSFSHISDAVFNAESTVIAIQSSNSYRVGSWFVMRTPGHEATFEFELSQVAKRIAFTDEDDRIAILESFADDTEPVFLNSQSGITIDPKSKPIVPVPPQLIAKPPVVLHYEQGDKPLVFPAPNGRCELLYFRPPVVPMMGAAGTGHLELKTAGGFTRKLESHVGIVTAVAFSDDSRWIATASDDGSISSGRASLFGAMADWESDALQQSAEIKVWNASTGVVIATMRGHSGIVNDLAFSPDAQRLASAGSSRPGVALDAIRGGQVIVWDPQSGQQLLSFQGGQGDFQCVAFSADGNRLAAAGKRLVIWDGTPLPKLEAPQPTPQKVEPATNSDAELLSDPVEEDLEEHLEEQLPPVPPLNYPPTTTSASLALRQVTPANFDLLAKLPELEELRISHYWAIDEDSKPPVTLFKALPQVKRLFIIEEVDHSDLQMIGRFTNLQSLHLSSFPGARPAGQSPIHPDDQAVDLLRPLLQCKQLSKAYLGEGVSDEQLKVLGEHPSLTSVTVDSAATGEFLNSWDKLNLNELRLTLRYSYPLKRPQLEGLAKFANLQTLSIFSYRDHVNLGSLDQLAEFNSLELTVPQFSDEDLLRATSRPKLETLRLRATKQTIPLSLLDTMEFPESIRELHFNLWVADDQIGSLGQTVVLKILAKKCPHAKISHFDVKWDPSHAHVPTADDSSEQESKK